MWGITIGLQQNMLISDESLKEACKDGSATTVYRKHVPEVPPATHLAVLQPRNTRQLLNEFDRVLVLQSSDHQLLSYDTTFLLGDFYVSTLTFCHIIFEENPVIPVFLLHERKHVQKFFDVCCKLIPALETTQIPALETTQKLIVTDEEPTYNSCRNCFTD